MVDGPGRIASVTGTVGIAWSRAGADDRETVLRHADGALYEAKRACKGTARTHHAVSSERLAG